MKCSFLDYVQLLMIGQAIQVMKVTQNAKKMATKSSKNEMLNLDYVQLLMISQATKVTQNAKKWLPVKMN